MKKRSGQSESSESSGQSESSESSGQPPIESGGTQAESASVEALVASLGEMGEHDLAAAVEITGQGLAYAKVVACATFGVGAVERNPDLVFEVYDRINDFFADRDEADDR